jgi:hypothetical protein
MEASLNRLKVKESARQILEEIRAGEGLTGGSLVALWTALGLDIYVDNSDLQCLPSRYIYLNNKDNKAWQIWHTDPQHLLAFIEMVSKKLRLRVNVSERLQHQGQTASALIFVSGAWFRSRVYRGDFQGPNMERARVNSLLGAFAELLSKETL